MFSKNGSKVNKNKRGVKRKGESLVGGAMCISVRGRISERGRIKLCERAFGVSL